MAREGARYVTAPVGLVFPVLAGKKPIGRHAFAAGKLVCSPVREQPRRLHQARESIAAARR